MNKKLKLILVVVVSCLALLSVVGLIYVRIAPFNTIGGAIWAENGVHFISSDAITNKINELVAPVEAKNKEEISKSTVFCNDVKDGFCEQADGIFAVKTLVTPAVEFKPAVPDRSVIVGYCTQCNDGTFSPSCAVGRGACSYHSGVSAYDVAQYRIIPGSAEVVARPATYSYAVKSYTESPHYVAAATPDLNDVVGFKN